MKFLEQKIEAAKPLLLEYQQILLRWQKKVNLISNTTIDTLWKRHILDSAQLYFYIPNTAKQLLDVGSGAGFPGVVIAILNKVLKGPLTEIILVESDTKKALFLEEVNRQLSLKMIVKNERIEKVQSNPDVITARAVAPLSKLLSMVDPLVSRETLLVFPKGKNVDIELAGMPKNYRIKKEKSIIDSDSCVLLIRKDSDV